MKVLMFAAVFALASVSAFADSHVVKKVTHDVEHKHVEAAGDHEHDEAHHKDHDHKAHHPGHTDVSTKKVETKKVTK